MEVYKEKVEGDKGKRLEGYREMLEGYREKVGGDIGKRLEGYREKVGGI